MHRGRRAHDQLAADELVPALESERNLKRRSLFDAQDQVDARRDALIGRIEVKLSQRCETSRLFLIRWWLV